MKFNKKKIIKRRKQENPGINKMPSTRKMYEIK